MNKVFEEYKKEKAVGRKQDETVLIVDGL